MKLRFNKEVKFKTKVKCVLAEFEYDGKSSEYCADKINELMRDEMINLLKGLEVDGGNKFVSASEIVDRYLNR